MSQISREDFEQWGEYWRFTSLSLRFLFEEIFPKENISIRAIEGIVQGSGSISGTIDICDEDGDNCVAAEPAMTFDGNLDRYTDIDVTSVSEGETLKWRTESVSGSIFVLIVVDYMVL